MDVDTDLDDEEPYRPFDVSFFLFLKKKNISNVFSPHNFQANLTASSSSNPETQMNFSMASWSTCDNVNIDQVSDFYFIFLGFFPTVYFSPSHTPFSSFLCNFLVQKQGQD